METRVSNRVMWVSLFAVLAGAFLIVMILATSSTGGYGMMGGGWGWGWMLIPMVLVTVLVLVLVFAAEPATLAPAMYPTPAPPAPGALETLNARYARGEVGREEYLRIRADLERRNP